MNTQQTLASSLIEDAPLAQMKAAVRSARYSITTAEDSEITGIVQFGNSRLHYPSLFSDPDGSHGAGCTCDTARQGQICRHELLLAFAVLRGIPPLNEVWSFTPAPA